MVSSDPRLRSIDAVRCMLAAIRHRGPDDERVKYANGATIGARRLAILDLERGYQPVANEAGDVWAVQNGEIYNFADVRRELIARGHQFHTANDTEILPHAYEEWGLDLVPRLRGMFALALWDERRQQLLLARDRFGKKPLLYAKTEDGLLFGSEIQALLAHPTVSRSVNAAAIADYLKFGYVPSPDTAFAEISKLPPAHTLLWRQGAVSLQRYWRPTFAPKSKLSFEDAADELRSRIDEAVRIRLLSDVPLGAFLSGGLDSSMVVAHMANHSERPVRTFSVGFRDHSYDELRYARLVAKAFGTDHTEFVVDASETDALPMLVRHLGEPFADSSIVPTYHVARVTRSHVTVALTGDGGDELFGGYDRYKAVGLSTLTADRLPKRIVAVLARLAASMPADVRLPHFITRVRRFAMTLDLPPESRYLRWIGYFTGPLWDLVVGDELRGIGNDPVRLLREVGLGSGAADEIERYMSIDMQTYLPGDLLSKMDIATMACSLEARSPLLDHELAEFVAELPARYKVSNGVSKVILRRAGKGILPEEILRRGKMGFMAPVATWLRGPLRDAFREMVLDGRAVNHGYISAVGAARLYNEHLSGQADRAPLLWALFMLELWFRECVNGTESSATLASGRAVPY